MDYITTDLIVYYITVTANICYGFLFVYHFVKKDSNKSLMILAGCLCLAMTFIHTFSSYKNSLDTASTEFYNAAVNMYLILVMLNALIVLAVVGLHRALKVEYHYVVRYVFRCVAISIVLNMALHVDAMMLGHSDSYLLYSLYSYGENLMTLFIFFSVLVARKWSEVFRWLRLAHSH